MQRAITTTWTCPNDHTVTVESTVFMGGSNGHIAFQHDSNWHACQVCREAAFGNPDLSPDEKVAAIAIQPTVEQYREMTAQLVEAYIARIRTIMQPHEVFATLAEAEQKAAEISTPENRAYAISCDGGHTVELFDAEGDRHFLPIQSGS